MIRSRWSWFTVAAVGLFVLMATDRPARATDLIVVLGAPGTDEYGKQFAAWADRIARVADENGFDLVRIGQEVDDEASDRDRLLAAISHAKSPGQDPLWIVLIGHGTFADNIAKFNLRGPDVSATDLRKPLATLDRPLILVNAASSSGPFVNRLSGDRRVIVTATQSGDERDFTRFGDYFSAAIASTDADLDHDDEVSVLEAFVRASAETRRFYDEADRIATEHALIDDNGDGLGTPAKAFQGLRADKAGEKADGKSAWRYTLVPAQRSFTLSEDQLAERAEIEDSLERLREQKADFDQAEFWRAIEDLMIRQAELYQAAKSAAEAESAGESESKPAGSEQTESSQETEAPEETETSEEPQDAEQAP